MIARWTIAGEPEQTKAHHWPDDATLPRAGELVRLWYAAGLLRVRRIEWDITNPEGDYTEDAVTIVLERS